MKTQINKWKTSFLVTVFSTATFFIAGQIPQSKQQKEHWKAPKWADTIKNPLAGNPYQAQIGKKLFDKQCVMCHGAEGKGNGTLAPGLNPKPADLTSKMTQSQSDGVLYWKIMNGLSPMPSYENAHKADHNQCWQMINYIRELGKQTQK